MEEKSPDIISRNEALLENLENEQFEVLELAKESG